MTVKMVPTVSVVVIRDGVRVKPEIGKSFDFTTEERDGLAEAHPTALRKVAGGDEEGVAVAAPTVKEKPVKSSAEASQAKAKGGKKASTAETSDDEAAQDEDL